MRIRNVCVLGGTGFVGRALAAQLFERGMRVRVVTRSGPRAAPLTVIPTVEVFVGDVHDPAHLRRAFENVDAVVNLVGILHETRHQDFGSAHVELPRKVVEACRASGVRHLLHMSSLGASPDGPSDYQRTKAAGEGAVRAAGADLHWTVFRPSVIFGEGDAFLNLFATMLRWFPVIPLAGARARFQPVWVEDVARCIARAAGEPRAFGESFDLCGPTVYTLEELVRTVGRATGRKARVWALPAGLASLQAAVLERLPGKLMTRDNLRSMGVDNVCDCPFPPLFAFRPATVEAILPEYLGVGAARDRYARFRNHASR